MANFCSGVKVRLFGGAAGSMSSSVTSSFWARSIKGVELVKVMVSVLPVSPWREERLRQVSHVSLTDRDGDAIGGEELPGPSPEGDRRGGLFVSMDLGVGEPAVCVDGRVDEGEAQTRPAGLAVVLRPGTPVDPPTASLGDLGLLLHVDMNELTGVRRLDASDDPSRHAVEVGESAHAVPLEDQVEGGGGHAAPMGKASRPELVTSPQLDDLALQPC